MIRQSTNTLFPRVNQRFLLATSTKIDVSGVKVPDNVNDKYFARYDRIRSWQKL